MREVHHCSYRSRHPKWTRLTLSPRRWPDHEDRIAGWIVHAEGARAPLLVARRILDVDLFSPFAVVAVRVVDVQRHAGVAPVSRHRRVDGDADSAALDA